jgi:phosphoglucomutase
VAVGLDPDADRHGIVTPGAGLMNPNHYLAVAVWYLFQNRPGWSGRAGVGKTLVSSSMIDRVARHLGGGSWRCPWASSGSWTGCSTAPSAFAGEESAGASFLRRDGTVWTTDKDGILLCLLAAEITAVTGGTPASCTGELEAAVRRPGLRAGRRAGHARAEEGAEASRPTRSRPHELAGEPIIAKLTTRRATTRPSAG